MRDIFTVLAMAICNPKEVPEVMVVHVWVQNKAVLVDLVRVIWNETHSRSKSVFGDYIALNVLWTNPCRRRRCTLMLLLRGFDPGVGQVEHFLGGQGLFRR